MNEKKKFDAILVDDDALVRMSWKLVAKSRKLDFVAFEKPGELLQILEQVDSKTPIYLDSNLGGGVRGELVAVELHNHGFTEIYIATGYEKDQLENLPVWIKGVVGKDPPF